LTTDQALADTAYFAKNVKFEGLEDVDFNPETTPWIAYGGSYAGAFVAFLRVAYPDIFWGAISSSGVPMAIWDYWEYFEAARVYGPAECIEATQKIIDVVDSVLLNEENAGYIAQLKDLYGLRRVSDNADFASALNNGIYGLQSYNWDPAVSRNTFFEYCSNVSSTSVLYPETEEKRASVEELLTVAGYGDEIDDLANKTLNHIGYSTSSFLAQCEGALEECVSTSDSAFFAQDDLSETWRLWPYQVCTE
jgi:hypothetical protein